MSLSFSDMWDLIQENHSPVVFSCELLVGIFWEETMFTNRKQLQGPAVGFGQVEPATMKAVNAYYGTKSPASIFSFRRNNHRKAKGGIRSAIVHYSVPTLTLDLLRQLTQLVSRASCSGLRRNVVLPPIARSEILNARPLSPSEGAPQFKPLRWSDTQFCLLALPS